jgi:hypothetical protein
MIALPNPVCDRGLMYNQVEINWNCLLDFYI